MNKIESFIEEYAPVTDRTNMRFCKGSKSLNNLVMVFMSGSYGHAVNAYKYISDGVIYYHDYSASSSGDGSILDSEMLHIYTFD